MLLTPLAKKRDSSLYDDPRTATLEYAPNAPSRRGVNLYAMIQGLLLFPVMSMLWTRRNVASLSMTIQRLQLYPTLSML
jgi:hypothetical protein